MSHNCDEALTNLYLYLDAEMDKVSAERIRHHLEACRGCSGSFDFERRLKMVVRTRLQEEVPEHLIERIRQVLASEPAGES
ncbi:MAG: mycothiol system anti-sigma-R factor [Acidimicrobiia bacterium]